MNHELRSKVMREVDRIRQTADRPWSDKVRVTYDDHDRQNDQDTYTLGIYVGFLVPGNDGTMMQLRNNYIKDTVEVAVAH